MADVAKTTGLAGASLEGFGKGVLKIGTGTRTTIEELQKIAEIGGQMGVTGAENLLKFTDSVNKFNVALGSDFSGGVEEAARSIAVLRNLFKETRSLDIADAITRSGSAINALSAKGVNVPELTDFIARVGQLPDAIKPSIQATAALGAVLNKAGITSEIGARGIGDILLTASQNLGAFSKQMKISAVEAKALLNTKPEEFLTKFASSLKGLDAAAIGPLLKSLKIGDTGSIKVVGALSTATEQLAEFQGIAADEFVKGTSLLNEYNTKNSTAAAKIARLKNNFQALAIIVGESLLPALEKMVLVVSPIIQSVSDWAKRNPVLIKTLALTAAAVGALSLAISAGALVVGVFGKAGMALTVVLRAVRTAMWHWKVVNELMLGTLNPLVLGIAAVAAVTYVLVKAITKKSTAEQLASEIQSSVIDKTVDQRIEIDKLFRVLKYAAKGSEDYKNALSRIEEIQPGIIRQYNLERGAIDDLNKAQKSLIATIEEKARAEARAEIFREDEIKKQRLLLELAEARDAASQNIVAALWESMKSQLGFGIAGNVSDINELNRRQAILKPQIEADERKALNLNAANAQAAAGGSTKNAPQNVNLNVGLAPGLQAGAATNAPNVSVQTTRTTGPFWKP
jgi:tubulin-specific chaperone A